MSNKRNSLILYVGRRSHIATTLREALSRSAVAFRDDGNPRRSTEYPFDFQIATNQRKSLDMIRDRPADIVLIETDTRCNARARFCEMLRYRLPTAAILAICDGEPKTSFDFDDWIRLPLDLTRVHDQLRGVLNGQTGHLLERGHIQLNVAARTVSTRKGQHHMTPKQCALLHLLMLNHDTVVGRAEIMQEIWNTSYLDDTRTLDVHIRWLRERIEPDPSHPTYLLTERGVGYRLSLSSPVVS